jgi:hypothetical protein
VGLRETVHQAQETARDLPEDMGVASRTIYYDLILGPLFTW